MNHGDLEELLSKIDGVWKKEQAHQIELLDRGEKYNIFNILEMATKEVRLHSAFIANLLNPKGEHGCGDLFLTNFLTLVLKQQIPHNFKTKEIQCYVEYYIGPVSGEYGGRIDILVQDSTYALIIENKIYAKENGAELHLKGYTIEYRKAGWQRAITIQLQGDNYYIGIPSTDPNIERLESLGKQSPQWMYGWEWLPIYDWWDPNNFKSIQEGTVYKWIVEKIETIEKELRTKRINL